MKMALKWGKVEADVIKKRHFNSFIIGLDSLRGASEPFKRAGGSLDF